MGKQGIDFCDMLQGTLQSRDMTRGTWQSSDMRTDMFQIAVM
jgi:hypothetical protein